MVLEIIFGLIIAAIIVFVAMRIVGNITLGILLVAVVFVISYVVIGSFPNVKEIPVIGRFFEFAPSITGDFSTGINNLFFRIEIIGTARDSQDNLLVVIENTGMFDVNGYNVLVDNTTTRIINTPKDPLKPSEATTLETDWRGSATSILVETNQTKATYSQ